MNPNYRKTARNPHMQFVEAKIEVTLQNELINGRVVPWGGRCHAIRLTRSNLV